MNYRWLSCWLDQRITTTVLGCLLGWSASSAHALRRRRICSRGAPSRVLCYLLLCAVIQLSARGQRVERREGLRPGGRGDGGAKCETSSVSMTLSPTQIEHRHARMRRFSNAATDQSQNRQMSTRSHKHMERVLTYGAPPPPPPHPRSFECLHLEKLRA